jgi:isocitrate dehydrogenase
LQNIIHIIVKLSNTTLLYVSVELDGNDPLRDFCTDLEAACVQVVDVDGVMTKDLALVIHGRQMKREHWVVTDAYLDAVNVRFFLHSRLHCLFRVVC